MGYLHIQNLYKAQDILLFKRCYAMEKIHGTSAHVQLKDGMLTYFSGGGKHSVFMELFAPHDDFKARLLARTDQPEVTIFGEFYGGNLQGMKATYGDKQRFVAFDVKIGERWLTVPRATAFCQDIGIDFVDWEETPTDIAALDALRDKESTQAIRNGCGPGKKREGVVLRPLMELTDNNGERIIAKHKRADFEERANPPKTIDNAKREALAGGQAIADEWVTAMRLAHVLDKMPGVGLEGMRGVLTAMNEDIQREAGDEVVWSKEATGAVNKRTAEMFKRRVMGMKNVREG